MHATSEPVSPSPTTAEPGTHTIRAGAGSPLGRAIQGQAADRELAALRQVLLAPEQALIKKIMTRLDDPAARAQDMAEALPAALAVATLEQRDLASALRPHVRDALATALKERPDLLLRAVRAALWDACVHPFAWGGRIVSRVLFRRRKARPARVDGVYLVRRRDGALIETAERPMAGEEGLDAVTVNERRNATAMAIYLLACLKDPVVFSHYSAMGHLRIEHRVFGVHVNDEHLLLSVIEAGGESAPVAELTRCEAILTQATEQSAAGPKLPAL